MVGLVLLGTKLVHRRMMYMVGIRAPSVRISHLSAQMVRSAQLAWQLLLWAVQSAIRLRVVSWGFAVAGYRWVLIPFNCVYRKVPQYLLKCRIHRQKNRLPPKHRWCIFVEVNFKTALACSLFETNEVILFSIASRYHLAFWNSLVSC